MNIAFFGTSDIGLETLEALYANFPIGAVVTTADKIGKRNKQLLLSPIKQKALKLGLDLLQPEKLDEAFIEQVNRCDIGILFSYGMIIPKSVIESFKFGILNIHPSILPKYRGASPIISAILNGEDYTGISIIKLTPQLDAGDILMQKIIKIDSSDNNVSLSKKISHSASQMILCGIEFFTKNLINGYPQKGNPTYTKKYNKQDAYINFQNENAKDIIRKIKAFAGYIEAYFSYKGKIYKLLNAELINRDGIPSAIIEVSKNSLIIACKKYSLSLELIKPEGKSEMPISAFLAGHKLKCGEKII